MSRQLTGSGIILPIIRKVICRDEVYVCCICRSDYKSKIEANNCLNQCWFDVQELYPVVVRKLNVRKVVFRCHFCCRDYSDDMEALNCARRCLNAANKQHIKEQLINELPIEAPNRRPSRLRLVTAKPQAAPPKSKIKARSKKASPQNNTTPEDKSAPAVEKTYIEKRRKKSAFPKHWVRADAKYQCKYCNQKFFTKMEVEACFNGHFDQEDFEILNP
ncbi:MAG: hypothetical protein NTX25_04295 [Proteobacteria bacterium]|nr:hypothetical protein [Pseudomonadota bacterium]